MRHFIQFELRTIDTQFEIFGIDKPVEVSTVDTKPVTIGSLISDEEETLNKLMSQGLDNVPPMSTNCLQNQQASASFGSKRELDELKEKLNQECKQTSHPNLRSPRVELLLSIWKLTIKDIEREQRKLKVKLPSSPKSKPKTKELRSTKKIAQEGKALLKC